MKVRVEGLAVTAIIGARTAEREMAQTLLVDIEYAVPTPQADCLEETANYTSVQEAAAECLQAGRFSLIETAAAAVAQRVAREFRVDDVVVRVAKPAASSAAKAVSAEYGLSARPRRTR